MFLTNNALKSLNQAGWQMPSYASTEEGHTLANMVTDVDESTRKAQQEGLFGTAVGAVSLVAGCFFIPAFLGAFIFGVPGIRRLLDVSTFRTAAKTFTEGKEQQFYTLQLMSKVSQQRGAILQRDKKRLVAEVHKRIKQWKAATPLVAAFKQTLAATRLEALQMRIVRRLTSLKEALKETDQLTIHDAKVKVINCLDKLYRAEPADRDNGLLPALCRELTPKISASKQQLAKA